MKSLPMIALVLSIVTVIFAVIGAFGNDIWLASTQWLLVASVLILWGIFFKLKD
jgi:hypothetical protein